MSENNQSLQGAERAKDSSAKPAKQLGSVWPDPQGRPQNIRKIIQPISYCIGYVLAVIRSHSSSSIAIQIASSPFFTPFISILIVSNLLFSSSRAIHIAFSPFFHSSATIHIASGPFLQFSGAIHFSSKTIFRSSNINTKYFCVIIFMHY